MLDIYTTVASLLIDLESELRHLQMWDAEPPSVESLASVEPFCIDTLEFYQWLQFVFLVRLSSLVANEAPLPVNCQIAPMAEEYFVGLSLDGGGVINVLKRVDQVLSGE